MPSTNTFTEIQEIINGETTIATIHQNTGDQHTLYQFSDITGHITSVDNLQGSNLVSHQDQVIHFNTIGEGWIV